MEKWYNVFTKKQVVVVKKEWVRCVLVYILEDGDRWEETLFKKCHRKQEGDE